MADITSSNWNEEDNLNNTPAPDGLPTGSPPNAVARSFRAVMGALTRFHKRINPRLVSTGTGAAYAISYEVAPTAYEPGETYSFRAHAENTGAVTLNINGLGTKSVTRNDGAALVAGQIESGQVVTVAYDGTKFLLQTPITSNPVFTGTISGNFSGDGTGLTNVNASTVGSVVPADIVQKTRLVSTGTGLTGGGDLSADRTLAVEFGTASGTVAAGDDTRIVNATARTGDAITGGFTATSKDLGSPSSVTIAPTGGNIQHVTNNSAITLNAPTASGVYTIIVEVVNGGSAGAVTLSGFTLIDGDDFSTTPGHTFHIHIAKTNSAVVAIVKALQ